MRRIIYIAALGCGLTIIGLHLAHAATALKCTAKGKTISQVITELKPATGYSEIDISGNCLDNIYIPPNQSILLVAAKGTTLAPANAGNATLTVEGRVQIENLAMDTGSFAAVFVNRGGYAVLLGGTITGVGTGVQVSDNSGAQIQNTAIAVTGNGVNLYAGANVEIDGDANVFGGNTTTITSNATSGGTGVGCNGGSITFSTFGGGSVVITGNTENGIYLDGCKLAVLASAANPVIIEKTGLAGQFSAGVNMAGGRALLNGLQVINNVDVGLQIAESASIQVAGDGVAITGNGGEALYAAQNAVIHIVPYNGVNTISEPSGNTQPLFSCYQGGKIYVDQVAGTITPAPTPGNIGCLTVGGP